jgi:tetrahydromethanopterin S-methyltransferase subunit G
MAEVSLSDQYILLLNDVVKENKALREKLDQCIATDQDSLRELKTKLDEMDNKISNFGAQRRHVRQTGGGKIPIPKMCSVCIIMPLYLTYIGIYNFTLSALFECL